MTVKEYLKQLWWIDDEINAKLRELEYLRTKAENCSAPEPTGMPRGSGTKDRISAVIIKLVDLQTYVNARTDELINLRSTITRQISELPDQRSRVVLTCRYLNRQKWEDIEEDLGYEHSYMMRLHQDALKIFGEAYPQIRKEKRKKQ